MTITIDRAVLEQALAALNLAHSSHGLMLLSDPPQEAWKVHRVDQSLQESSTALREALNAPQPEPRREWVPLSLDQISMAWDRAYRQPLSQAALNFARDLEAALKERNT